MQMSRRLVNVDRATPLLLPVDMREWVGSDDVVHLVIEAVDQMDLRAAPVNERGTGSEQYPPGMLLALLIYCYAQGIYSSRRIERATHTHVAIRYLTGDTHPDHDTIASFRRTQTALLRQAFVEVLQLAHHLGVPQLGTVCLDGTKLKANASQRANRREAELRAELQALDAEVASRLDQAEKADRLDQPGEQLPSDLVDRCARRARIVAARAALQQRAAEQKRPPRDTDLGNTTDPDSRPQPTAHGCIQGYNAQVAASAESGLIVAAHVCTDNQDRRQLLPTVEAIPAAAGRAHTIVADTGYDSHTQVMAVEQASQATVYVPPQLPVEVTTRQSHARGIVSAERAVRLNRVRSPQGQALMRLRRILVEPIFGTLKSARGFGRFHLRGLVGVNAEWTLLCTAYNVRRLHRWCALHPAQ
jgi:transposase